LNRFLCTQHSADTQWKLSDGALIKCVLPCAQHQVGYVPPVRKDLMNIHREKAEDSSTRDMSILAHRGGSDSRLQAGSDQARFLRSPRRISRCCESK
jgi:hypothetical protein